MWLSRVQFLVVLTIMRNGINFYLQKGKIDGYGDTVWWSVCHLSFE